MLAFILESNTRQRLKWSHIRAALKNYHSEKGVSEYEVREVKEIEEVGHYKHVPYKQSTDNTGVDKKSIIGRNGAQLLVCVCVCVCACTCFVPIIKDVHNPQVYTVGSLLKLLCGIKIMRSYLPALCVV